VDSLNTVAAAALLGVSPATPRKWADSGRVPCGRTAGGHRRFDRATIEAARADLNGYPRAGDPAAVERWTRAALAVLDGAGVDLGPIQGAPFRQAADVIRWGPAVKR
jgi:excisionase family DNA binding protein